MQLLIQRGQSTTSLGMPRFDLWAKYEFTPDEQALVNQYDISSTVFVEGKPRDLRRACLFGVIPAFIALVCFMIFL